MNFGKRLPFFSRDTKLFWIMFLRKAMSTLAGQGRGVSSLDLGASFHHQVSFDAEVFSRTACTRMHSVLNLTERR